MNTSGTLVVEFKRTRKGHKYPKNTQGSGRRRPRIDLVEGQGILHRKDSEG